MRKSLLFVILLVLVPLGVSAQLNFDFGSSMINNLASELSVDLSTSNPRPGDRVAATLRMYTENLNTAFISWYINDSLNLSAIGATRNELVINDKTTIRIEIDLANGESFEKTVEITPASVDLMWQADTYTHPFYAGKALYSPQSSVVVKAYPEIPGRNPNELVYKWTANTSVLESQSGYGKRVMRTRGPLLGTSLNINLMVTDPISGVTAEKNLVINPVDPEIVFYENSPLYGIGFDNAIGNSYSMNSEEINILATPFYMSVRDNVDYSWNINGVRIPDISGISATFRRPSTSGRSSISISAENTSRVLQYSENSFIINYEDENDDATF